LEVIQKSLSLPRPEKIEFLVLYCATKKGNVIKMLHKKIKRSLSSICLLLTVCLLSSNIVSINAIALSRSVFDVEIVEGKEYDGFIFTLNYPIELPQSEMIWAVYEPQLAYWADSIETIREAVDEKYIVIIEPNYFSRFNDPAPNLDTASSWARDGINSAYTKGFIPYDIMGNYTNIITREEFCRMAVLFVEYWTGKNIDDVMTERHVSRDPNAFTDTNDPDVLAAFALGITNGTGDGKFTPDGDITREQAAQFMYNIINWGRIMIYYSDPGFVDAASISDWAREAVNHCYGFGIMKGTSETALVFSPKMTFTREQSIVMFDRMS